MLFIAFITGLVGSLHCVIMCGPLTSVVGLGFKTFKGSALSVTYHVARILAYGVLGVLIGTFLKASTWLRISQLMSFVLGVVFILLGLLYLLNKPAGLEQAKIGKWITRVYGAVMRTETNKFLKFFLSGFVNGLMPCAMVYAALSISLTGENIYQSTFIMIAFGAGTLPALLFYNFFTSSFKGVLNKIKTSFVLPIVLTLMGGVLLLRGANIHVPYISNEIYINQQTNGCYDE